MEQTTDLKAKGTVYEEDLMVKAGRKYGMVTGGGSSWAIYGEKGRSLTAIEERLCLEPELKAKLVADLKAKVLK